VSNAHKWRQSTGEWFFPDGKIAFTGYAGGNGGKRPEAVNNPAFEAVRNVGPLPKGRYMIGRIHDKSTDGAAFDSRFGPSYIRLVADAANVMHGRDGFLIHWDRADRAKNPRAASDGCIIPHSYTAILEIGGHPCRLLEVVE
jgi:hypothetical protein